MTDGAVSAARVAALLGDPTRMAMCLALLDGRAWTAGELARHTGVCASTASEHLTGLVSAGLLVQERQGRHRYVRLEGPRVATLLEDLAGLADVPLPEPTSLRAVRDARGLAEARTCYDHLAGRLGVALLDAMVEQGLVRLSCGPMLTPAGEAWLEALAPGADLTGRHRPVLRTCLDWTERRHHLGGAAGAALRTALAERGWTRQRPGQRHVVVTGAGAAGLADLLGIDVPAVAAGPAGASDRGGPKVGR